jgi:hypothetical protein
VKARWKDENRDLRVEMSGEITFAPDERSVAVVSPSGYLEFEEIKGWSRRRLEVRPSSSGAPEEKYFVDGRQRLLDETGRAWVAATYLRVMRELGIDLEGRVGRILEARGVTGVLQEVDLIRSDDVKRRYLSQLMKRAALTSDDFQRIAISARRIGSDHEKAEFLLENIRRFTTDPLRSSYFQAVDSIRSDSDRRRVLIGILDADGHSQETANYVGRSVKSMGSDHDKSEVLLAMPPASEQARCALLAAARTIQSDNDRARVLRRSGYVEASQCRDAFFSVVNQIHSDNDRASVLRELLGHPGLGAVSYQSIASAAKRMSSNSDKANVLKLLGEHYTDRPFFDAVNTVQSEDDRKSVLKDVIKRDPDKAVLLQVIDSVSRMSSDNSKAEVLIAAAMISSEVEVRSAVQQASAKIGSDSDYRRVARVLMSGTTESERPR